MVINTSNQLCDHRSLYGIRGHISHKVTCRSNNLGWLLSAAISLAMDGLYGKACQALTSSGVAPDTDETWNLHVLVPKYPHFPPPISNLLHALDTYNQSASLDTLLTATDVVNTKFCQKKFHPKLFAEQEFSSRQARQGCYMHRHHIPPHGYQWCQPLVSACTVTQKSVEKNYEYV